MSVYSWQPEENRFRKPVLLQVGRSNKTFLCVVLALPSSSSEENKDCGRRWGGDYTMSVWRNNEKKNRVHKFVWDIHKQFFPPYTYSGHFWVCHSKKKPPLKKLLKTGFNSQTYNIIVISSESCGNIGSTMEGRTSFVMGEGLYNRSVYLRGLVHKGRGEDSCEPAGRSGKKSRRDRNVRGEGGITDGVEREREKRSGVESTWSSHRTGMAVGDKKKYTYKGRYVCIKHYKVKNLTLNNVIVYMCAVNRQICETCIRNGTWWL